MRKVDFWLDDNIDYLYHKRGKLDTYLKPERSKHMKRASTLNLFQYFPNENKVNKNKGVEKFEEHSKKFLEMR